MADSGYWQRFTRSRVSRRRALATGGTILGGAVALSLVGCGSDDEDAPTATGGSTGSGSTGAGSTGATGAAGTGASGLTYEPVDTTAQARERARSAGVLQFASQLSALRTNADAAANRLDHLARTFR